jgi:hypothetical protein
MIWHFDNFRYGRGPGGQMTIIKMPGKHQIDGREVMDAFRAGWDTAMIAAMLMKPEASVTAALHYQREEDAFDRETA